MTTGERLGRHVWEEELIRDAGGNFMHAQVSHLSLLNVPFRILDHHSFISMVTSCVFYMTSPTRLELF